MEDFAFDFTEPSQTITIDEFRDNFDCYSTSPWREISNTMIDQTRWITHREVVLGHTNGTFWEFSVGYGSTENQDDDEEVHVQQVEPTEKTIIVYTAVEEENIMTDLFRIVADNPDDFEDGYYPPSKLSSEGIKNLRDVLSNYQDVIVTDEWIGTNEEGMRSGIPDFDKECETGGISDTCVRDYLYNFIAQKYLGMNWVTYGDKVRDPAKSELFFKNLQEAIDNDPTILYNKET
jgi:hypothetical protein